MPRLGFILALFFAVCVSFATSLAPAPASRRSEGQESASVLVAILGDSRRLFANEAFAKADAYFHRGKYPSIFDIAARKEENHMRETADEVTAETQAEGEHSADEHDESGEHADEAPPARDFLDEFGRHFRPTAHVHLHGGEEREMLPWLQLAAELDPHQIESYAVGAYWLRQRLGKVDEAEQFLREGLRQNPNHPELLYELGRLYFSNRKDLRRAENIWSLALRRWHEVEAPKKDPDKGLLEQILGGLVEVETAQKHFSEAINYWRQMKDISPHPEVIQKRIDELEKQAQAPTQP